MKQKNAPRDDWDRFQDEGALMLVLAYAGMAVLIVSLKFMFFR
jgi:hypothetical protein